MIEGYVKWESLVGAEIGSLGALDETIDRLQRKAEEASPIIVEVQRADGEILSIGLGREEAVLSFTAASGNPPYYVSSSGWQAGENEDILDYDFYGHRAEIRRRYLVPMQQARDALRFFWETGERTKDIIWEEV